MKRLLTIASLVALAVLVSTDPVNGVPARPLLTPATPVKQVLVSNHRIYPLYPAQTHVHGLVTLPGSYIDIIATVTDTEGNSRTVIVAEKVLVLDSQRWDDHVAAYGPDHCRLQLTATQVTTLDQAMGLQSRLRWLLRRRDD